MANTDIENVLHSTSIIISGGTKVGKITLLSYLVQSLFKTKAIVFTTQEKYLFDRRIKSLSTQFEQFSGLNDLIKPYYLKENWHNLKQKYGYAFFINELEHIIATSEEKLIVMHRIGEYFEFQDRYEIENVYRSLIKTATTHDKKIIFIASTKNENYDYIKHIADEFSDVSISIGTNENNERLLNIRNLILNQEYPVMRFKIDAKRFNLDYYHETKHKEENQIQRALIVKLDNMHENIRQLCTYLLDRENFEIKYADSLQSMLDGIFLMPDIIIVLMKRKDENFATLKTIKQQLPKTNIIAILDQNFVRVEDQNEAYRYGCDELFSTDFTIEKLVLALQKAAKKLFYSDAISALPHFPNVLDNLEDLRTISTNCIEKSIYFSAFILESEEKIPKITSTSRKNDFIYQNDKEIYYLAIDILPKDIKYIIKNLSARYSNLSLKCIWEPINHVQRERCLS